MLELYGWHNRLSIDGSIRIVPLMLGTFEHKSVHSVD